ncbi:D-alanine--D-alanine ligase [Rickettsia canadensis str. McKiel]|uniref:D-alanine--D-alanine ligase n=1 Tax=Rickettsia canadensis (strain McKiel) TaxID=293613 RepID=A8EY04_RICCK|nr:D-alanine--D-alanine ligase [Rickettsia canadensis str. McKiel]
MKSTGQIFGNHLGGAANLAASIIKGASGNVLDILKNMGYGIVTTASLIINGLSLCRI